jgi:hypothetical protein
MVGITTGEPSGLVVLDIDRGESKGIDAFAVQVTSEASHGPLSEIATQRMPRRGEHRLFKWPALKVKRRVYQHSRDAKAPRSALSRTASRRRTGLGHAT